MHGWTVTTSLGDSAEMVGIGRDKLFALFAGRAAKLRIVIKTLIEQRPKANKTRGRKMPD
jgi:hypothetical protein